MRAWPTGAPAGAMAGAVLGALLAAMAAGQGRAAVSGAAGSGAECTWFHDFAGAPTPSLRIVAGAKTFFRKSGSVRPGCPAAANCEGKAFVLPGDAVVIRDEAGDYACATFTGAAPKAASSSGWLPKAALAEPPAAAVSSADWAGDWRSGPEQKIRIRPAPGGRIAIDGDATWGGTDPARVARGAVNLGSLDATVTPDGNAASFMVDTNGKERPLDAARAEKDNLCAVRLWRLGPFLAVDDNVNCGGHNVTFMGLYRAMPAGRR